MNKLRKIFILLFGIMASVQVMAHIRRIREKIELNPKEPEYLKVVWGIGYKIEKMEK